MNALVSTVVEDPMDFTVVASNPFDMAAGQKSLILWAARKVQSLKGQAEYAGHQLKLSEENGWNPEAWRSQVRKYERRAEFYRKIKAALEAGYYIVPPFPIDIFAIRTKKGAPDRTDGTHRDNHDQSAQILPIGEGRYVEPKPARETYVEQEEKVVNHQTGAKGNVPVRYYYASEWRDCDFPFKLARAEIREATDKAMSLKVFDQIGVLPRTRKPDPLVVGQILVPDKANYGWGNREAISFFVAWWLDTKML